MINNQLVSPIFNEVENKDSKIYELQEIVLKMPQIEVETSHYFSGGMYCRKVFRKKGALIIGKMHKKDHFFMCASGTIHVVNDDIGVILNAGDVIESKAGTKRATYALTDAIGITIHKTDKTDLDEIEKELIEIEECALFDSSNKLKKDISE